MSRNEKRFEVIHQENSVMSVSSLILRDTFTGALYLFVQNGYAGGLTPLLGADGQPLVSHLD